MSRSISWAALPASARDALSPALLRGLLVLAVIYAALLTLPHPMPVSVTGLDPSWELGLNLAHARGLVAGRDVVFSYGPLGYLVFAEPASGAPVLAFVYKTGLYLLLLAALTRLMWIIPSKVAGFWTAMIVGLGVALDAQPQEDQVVLTMTVVALLALVDRSRWRRLELLVLAFLASLALMVKLNQGAEGVALLVVVLAVTHARRQAAEAIGGFLLSSVVLFFAATGSVLALGPYLRYGWEIASGYSEAMGLPGPLWQAALACATLALAFAGIPLLATDLRALLPGFGPALLAAFFEFKHAMVRQDGHAAFFHIRLAVVLLFLLVCARSARDRRLILLLQLFSIVMACAIQTEKFAGLDSDFKARLELRQAYNSLAEFRHWPARWQQVGASNQIHRAKLRLPAAFDRLIRNGTVDAIPWNIDLVQGNGWKWQPRPVIQSYSAYTPALDRLNANHLESGRAADFVVLDFGVTDGRHPFLETPVSWRALLDRYDLKLAGAGYFLLQHRQTSRYGPLAPLGSSMTHWDAEVRVPQAGGLLVMAAHMHASLSGKLTALLFRTAPVYADVTSSSGKIMRWRCVPPNLAGGFLVRPFPQDLAELRPLFLADPFRNSPEQIVSIRFHTDRPGEFMPQIAIDWFRLPVVDQGPVDSTPRPLPTASLTPLWLPKDPLPQPSQVVLRRERNWLVVTPLTDDPQLLFHLGPDLGRFPTLIVRARFQKADRIDAFFGKQGDRGVNGIVPRANEWLDVYLNMSHNLFWQDEHGMDLRFDPVSSFGPGTTAYIAGIWGSTEAALPAAPDIEFYPVPPAK